MTKLQKRILANFVVVMVITGTAVVGMVELKNLVNRSEAMRAMESLGRVVSDYKQKNGSIPPEAYIDGLKQSFEGQLRLGHLHYRAQWIQFGSPSDTILAYVIKDDHSLFSHPGAIVLRLDGRIEWIDRGYFDKLPIRRQSAIENEMAPK